MSDDQTPPKFVPPEKRMVSRPEWSVWKILACIGIVLLFIIGLLLLVIVITCGSMGNMH